MPRSPSFLQQFIVTAAVAGVIVILHFIGALAPIERGLTAGLAPLGRAIDRGVRSMLPRTTTSDRDLRARVADLEQQLARLSVENVQLRTSLEAAQESSEQRSFLSDHRLRGVFGRVIARSPDPTAQTILVDIGSDQGVVEDAPAITRDGLLIGRVTKVTAATTTILLTTDNRSSFAAVLADNSLAEGVVNGDRGLALRMELIPQNQTVTSGETVMTSGTEPNVPRGLVLGAIDRVDRQEGALFQTATVRTLIAPQQIDGVTIIAAGP